MSHSRNKHRAQKKAQFAEPARRQNRIPVLVGLLVVVVITIGYVIARDQGTGSTYAGIASPVTASGTDVQIPIADLSDGKAKFFEYAAANGRRSRFFVMRSSDGVYRAALDACDVCYAGKKGYFQSGDDMVCKKCGQRFPSALVNVVRGGCNPVPVERSVAGNMLVIKASELEGGSSYF